MMTLEGFPFWNLRPWQRDSVTIMFAKMACAPPSSRKISSSTSMQLFIPLPTRIALSGSSDAPLMVRLLTRITRGSNVETSYVPSAIRIVWPAAWFRTAIYNCGPVLTLTIFDDGAGNGGTVLPSVVTYPYATQEHRKTTVAKM